MQYIINKFSNLFRSKSEPPNFTDIAPPPDVLKDYIVEKSKSGPYGTYIYSDPSQNYRFHITKKPDQFYDYIVEKSKSGPKGWYSYSDPKQNIAYSVYKST